MQFEGANRPVCFLGLLGPRRLFIKANLRKEN